MKENQVFALNLDCLKLKHHAPSARLYMQLARYPQEIIPLMDHALTEIMMERFDDLQLPEDVSVKVRPFNLGRQSNLRDLNPAGMSSFFPSVCFHLLLFMRF
jgi:DNA replication licensing factor MCM4